MKRPFSAAKIRAVLRELGIVAAGAVLATIAYDKITDFRSTSVAGRSADSVGTLAIGQEIKVGGAALLGRDLTVILITSPTCVHCRADSQFHRELLAECIARKIPMIVAIPKIPEATKYVTESALQGAELRVWQDLSFRAQGTPTIVMVDGSSVARRIFVGEVASSDRKKNIFSVLSKPSSLRSTPDTIATGERNLSNQEVELMKRRQSIVILDVRERREFAQGHADGAINLPLEELDIRAAFELKSTDLQVIDCSALRENMCQRAVNALKRQSYRVAALNSGSLSATACLTTYD